MLKNRIKEDLIESLEVDYRELLVKVIRDLEKQNTFSIESLKLLEGFSLNILSVLEGEDPKEVIKVFNTLKNLVKVKTPYKEYKRVLDKRIDLIIEKRG